MEDEPSPSPLKEARDEFVSQWGTIGNAWGINRTMAQIHALLMTSAQPLSTDEIMAELKISRGNANTNLRDLVGWGLIRSILRKGERKEFFVAEKDVWKIFCIVARERKRREISPAMEVLLKCEQATKGLSEPGAAEFHHQMQELLSFLKMGEKVLAGVTALESSKALRFASRFLK